MNDNINPHPQIIATEYQLADEVRRCQDPRTIILLVNNPYYEGFKWVVRRGGRALQCNGEFGYEPFGSDEAKSIHMYRFDILNAALEAIQKADAARWAKHRAQSAPVIDKKWEIKGILYSSLFAKGLANSWNDEAGRYETGRILKIKEIQEMGVGKLSHIRNLGSKSLKNLSVYLRSRLTRSEMLEWLGKGEVYHTHKAVVKEIKAEMIQEQT